MTLAIKPSQAAAEAIRQQLGTNSVVLIVPGEASCAVFVASPAETKGPPATPVHGTSPDITLSEQGDKIAYSLDEAATALGVSRDLIYDELRTGRLKSIKVGRRRIITRKEIERFLSSADQQY